MVAQAQQTLSETHRIPPTAQGLPVIGNTLSFMNRHGLPVDFLRRSAAQHGDVVLLNVSGRPIYLLSSPELVHEVLVKRVKDFDKNGSKLAKPVALARFLGNSILTADFEDWRPQRKLIQPLMHTKHIKTYADTMARFGDKMIGEWHDGATRDIHADMVQVTMWIIAETMFGMDIRQTPGLQHSADRAQAIALSDVTSPLPAFLTKGRDREAEEINAGLTALVERIMSERRAHSADDQEERYDLLSLLMNTRDEDGQPMPDDVVRNNILTLFFAGHETTANTLTWAMYYLDRNPDVAAKLHQEVDTVLGGRAPTLADLPNLPYTLMVIKETMRIEPTVSVFPRWIVNDTELGGYTLKGGSVLFMSPYVLHHDPRWWSEPEQFDPTRFSAENEQTITDYAYLPFGGGPRVCIGNHFALMEAQILLAMFVGRYTFALAGDNAVQPLRQITTSPEKGLVMRIAKR